MCHCIGDVEDIHHMSYPDESFDVVIDKGTLDAIICGDEATCDPDKVLLEVNRVLKKDGVYICITFGMPENRMDYFQKSPLKWKITHVPIRCSRLDSLTRSKEGCFHTVFPSRYRVLPPRLHLPQIRMSCL